MHLLSVSVVERESMAVIMSPLVIHECAGQTTGTHFLHATEEPTRRGWMIYAEPSRLLFALFIASQISFILHFGCCCNIIIFICIIAAYRIVI